MKVSVRCFKCDEEARKSNETRFPKHSSLNLPVRDDGVYEVECVNGHAITCILQAQLFELLFQIACNATLDEYYREGVASANCALERFFELFIRIICSSKSLDESEIEACWKNVSRQSERQLGAYMFLYLSEFKEQPLLLDKKYIEYRNSVIHKGKIPTHDETWAFLNAVYALIIGVLYRLHENGFSKNIGETIFKHQKVALQKKKMVSAKNSFLSMPTILDVSDFVSEERSPKTSRELSLERLKSIKKSWERYV